MAYRDRWLATIVAGLLLVTVTGVHAQEDDAQSVEGAADFRTAPLLEPGSFREQITVGETVWYAVVYRNRTSYEISASLPDSDPDEELRLVTSFVAPNLNTVQSDDDMSLAGEAWYGNEMNQWFISFSLESNGRLGALHELRFTLDGFESAEEADCRTDPSCDLDGELAALETELASLEDTTPGDGGADRAAEVEQLEAKRSNLQASLAELDARIASACGGEACDEPTTTTPSLATVAAALLALAGLVLLGNTMRRRHRVLEHDGARRLGDRVEDHRESTHDELDDPLGG